MTATTCNYCETALTSGADTVIGTQLLEEHSGLPHEGERCREMLVAQRDADRVRAEEWRKQARDAQAEARMLRREINHIENAFVHESCPVEHARDIEHYITCHADTLPRVARSLAEVILKIRDAGEERHDLGSGAVKPQDKEDPG
jgi:hypothetical protein